MVGGGATIQHYPPSVTASPASRSSEHDAHARNDGLQHLRGSPVIYIPLLAIGVLGIQVVWSTEMAFASPYLLELGLSKSSMAAVFVAGPLSGLLVQPIVGAISDKCTHRWGRRRPFLAVAVVLCTANLLLLGYARSLSHTLTLGSSPEKAERLTLALAVISIFGIDFSVNAVMSVGRALILDILPASHQAIGNAWAVRLTSVGLLVGFLIGNIDLPNAFPFSWLPWIWKSGYPDGAPPSEAQIKCMSVTTVTFLVLTQSLTAYAAVEQVFTPEHTSQLGGKHAHTRSCVQTVLEPIRELKKTATNLPDTIWSVFKVQFFNWIAMYPLLFWGTTWIGSIYRQQESSQAGTPDEIAERGTRLGSLAMFYQSLFSLAISILLPLLLPATSSTTPTARPRIPWLGAPLPIWNVSLASLWALSHFCYSLSMVFTWPAAWWSSTFIAMLIITATGFSVATVNWIPFTLLGILVHEAEDGGTSTVGSEAERLLGADNSRTSDQGTGGRSRSHAAARRPGEGDDNDEDLDALSFGADQDVEDARNERLRGTTRSAGQTHAGAVLGLHNVSIVAGQLAATAMSSIVFAFTDAPKPVIVAPQPPSGDLTPPSRPPSSARRGTAAHTNSDPDAIGVVLRIGIVSAAVAGVLCLKLSARMTALEQGRALRPRGS